MERGAAHLPRYAPERRYWRVQKGQPPLQSNAPRRIHTYVTAVSEVETATCVSEKRDLKHEKIKRFD